MIPADRAHLYVAASTHPGMKGKNNEDQYAVSAYLLSEADPTPSLLAIVSDGIGGHRAGEVASQIAVETISRTVAKSDGSNPTATLEDAITLASQAIVEQAELHPEKRGMGATCVCAWVIGNRLYSASVGDSRLYLLRGNSITQLTTDHTWIQEAIEYGALTPEQARRHPNVHVIRRYLGSQPPPEVDFRLRVNPAETDSQAQANQGFPLIPGDFLLLCSDGLTDLVDQAEIKSTLRSHSREEALQALTQLANQRGGHDNITIVVLEVPSHAVKTQISQVRIRSQRKKLLALLLFFIVAGFLLTLLLLAIAGGIWFIFNASPSATPTLASSPTQAVLPALSTLTPIPLEQTPTPRVETPVLPSATASPTNTLAPTSTPSRPPPSPTPTLP